MLRRLSRHIRQNAVAWLALFVALGGTSAYAANTIRSSDIIDNEITTTDVRDDTLGFGGLFHQDLAAGSVRSAEVLNESLTGSDIATNSLQGIDIDEATLSSTATATLTGQGNVPVGNVYNKIVGRTLNAGSYAVTATANVGGVHTTNFRTTFCELRSPSGATVGSARDGRHATSAFVWTASLSMNAGVQVPAGGGEVSLWCRYDGGATELVGDGQMMIVRLSGLF